LSSVLSSSFFLLSSCLSLFFLLLRINQWRFGSLPLCGFLVGAIYNAYFQYPRTSWISRIFSSCRPWRCCCLVRVSCLNDSCSKNFSGQSCLCCFLSYFCL
jgi:hypothetical protein